MLNFELFQEESMMRIVIKIILTTIISILTHKSEISVAVGSSIIKLRLIEIDTTSE